MPLSRQYRFRVKVSALRRFCRCSDFSVGFDSVPADMSATPNSHRPTLQPTKRLETLARHAAVVLLVAATALPAGATTPGRVVSVRDGDTLVLLDDQSRKQPIRLAGIDAPEPGQPGGTQSATVLSGLVLNHYAQLTCVSAPTKPVSPLSPAGLSRICRVYIDGADIALEQVRTGMAWYAEEFAAPLDSQTRAAYKQAELTARTQRLGLWRGKNPVPPKTWRKGHTEN